MFHKIYKVWNSSIVLTQFVYAPMNKNPKLVRGNLKHCFSAKLENYEISTSLCVCVGKRTELWIGRLPLALVQVTWLLFLECVEAQGQVFFYETLILDWMRITKIPVSIINNLEEHLSFLYFLTKMNSFY